VDDLGIINQIITGREAVYWEKLKSHVEYMRLLMTVYK